MKFCYINTENKYPHDLHLIDGMRQNGHEVIEICDKSPGFAKYKNIAKQYRNLKTEFDAIIVGFPSPVLVPLARILSFKTVIFNAVSSQYEANVISREGNNPGFLKIIKWWLIDFVSFHLPTKVLLESNSQIEYIHRLCFVPKKKLIKSYSGLDEKEFFYIPTIKKQSQFTVLFRGRFLPESGILTVIEAAKELENSGIKFLIIGHGYLHKEVNILMQRLSPKNTEIIGERVPWEKLRELMMSSHISLGQLANHPRLLRTLPCKLFESLALRLPYLTGRNKAALELLAENQTCICSNPGDAKDLAEKVLYLKNNPSVREKIAEAGYHLYKEKLTAKKLSEKVVNACFQK